MALMVVLGALAPAAFAQTTYGDVARVISATPIYDRVAAPRRDCRPEQVTAYEERRTVQPGEPRGDGGIGAGTVLGAIVGGVIGHQFGNSTGGRDHGTAAGAVIGGLVGNAAERDADARSRDVVVERTPVTREVQRCTDVMESREVVAGYDVRYEYNGREFRARLPQDPGPEMPVNVEVRPPSARPAYDAAPRPPRYGAPY